LEYFTLKGGVESGVWGFFIKKSFFVVNFFWSFVSFLFFFTFQSEKGDTSVRFSVNKYNLCLLHWSRTLIGLCTH
jgi:hypothetical protein